MMLCSTMSPITMLLSSLDCVVPWTGCKLQKVIKYKVAKRWGHIHIMNRKWFDQSTSRKACLNEESYPVRGSSMSSVKTANSQQNQDRVIRSSQSLPSSTVGDRDFHPATNHADPDLETTLSQNVYSMFADPHFLAKEDDSEVASVQSHGEA